MFAGELNASAVPAFEQYFIALILKNFYLHRRKKCSIGDSHRAHSVTSATARH
jgi:hypothetical protein